MWWDYLQIADRLTFGRHSMWWLTNVMSRTCCCWYSALQVMENTRQQGVSFTIDCIKDLATINISMHFMLTVSTIDYALDLVTIN